ncbi:mechanosensitive ion channel family protein [Lacimicrobium alkaliphilum]|uniref:Mechanosensitive ion channel protein MscS n=1 Tax=Lacimicrobium alkaliphilum TaxID=1526571 RepID=A0A0U2JIG2_9ALTE|nr:mechanosensitive ion channel family protein [Lacimicrobium alkaliphilum]ALS97526.1 mechanosensitive ion channel protein MscS [Lacimicrobium alkaliphilum]
MEFWLDKIFTFMLTHKLVTTLLLLFVMLGIKRLIVRLVRRRGKKRAEDKRPAVNAIKNVSNMLLVVFILVLWSAEVQTLAFSIAAFMVAIVLAMREYIQCFTGFIYATSARMFRVGDWIQVGDHYGEVIESDWLSLTLLEVHMETYEYSGKTLNVPNNLLITRPVKNLNFLKRYSTHSFILTRDQSVNVFAFKEQLQEKARSYCEHFHDVALRYNNLIEKRLDVNISGPDPAIRITTSHLGDTETRITIFCPTDQAIDIEQKITEDFMQLWFASRDAKEPLPQPDE